jgi:cellobiose-specific phosphotransferase system component IIA
MVTSDEERAAFARVVAARSKLLAAVDLVKQGELTPEKQEAVKRATEAVDEARRAFRAVLAAQSPEKPNED